VADSRHDEEPALWEAGCRRRSGKEGRANVAVAGENEHGNSPEHDAACQAKARNGHRFPLQSAFCGLADPIQRRQLDKAIDRQP
jgi:hypothetical protein